MNRESLVSVVSAKTGLSKARVSVVLENILLEIEAAVSEDEAVRLQGFGTFRAKYNPPRTVPDFAGGKTVDVPGKYVPTFLPGSGFRNRVKEGLNGGENHNSGG